MKTIISAKNVKLSQDVKNTVESRLEHLALHYPEIIKATCFMKNEKGGANVEILVSGKKINKTARAKTHNLYLSIHEAVDKMEIQLEKAYGKRVKKGLHLGEIEAQLAAAELAEEEVNDPALKLTLIELEEERLAS